MQKISILILLLISLLSCKSEDEQPTETIAAKHQITVDGLSISGSSSIKVKTTFNLAYDPTIDEIGIVLINDSNRLIGKKVFDLSTLKSMETVYFNSLRLGSYSVRSYLINHNQKDTIYSNTETIKIQTIDFNDYAITCYPTYYSADGKAVYGKNTGEFVVIFMHTNRELPIDEIKIKLGDSLLLKPDNIEKESYSELKKYEYYIQFNITDLIKSGLYDIELSENNVTYPTGVQLDKLGGSWERIKSLFSGKRNGGAEVYFQSGKYAYIGIVSSYYDVTLYKFDLENYIWQDVSTSLNVSPSMIWDQTMGKIIDGKAYLLLNIIGDYQLWAYDIEQQKWNFITRAPSEANDASGSLVYFLNNKLFLAGGGKNNTNSTTYYRNVWCYDIVKQSWLKKNNQLPFDFYGYSSTYPSYSTFSSDHSAYFIISKSTMREFWRYSEENDSWTELAMPYPMLAQGGRALYHNGLFYYVGGKLIESYFEASTKRCYTYSEQTNTWKQIADLPNEMNNGVAFDYNNQLFFGLGYGSYESTVSMFKYRE